MKQVFDSPLIRLIASVNTVLLLLLLVPLFWPLPSANVGAGGEITAADIADYLGESEIVVSEALERPLFHANRRQAVAEEAAPIVVAAPVQQEEVFTLELVGVMGATASQRTAFLSDTASATTHTVRQGGAVAGWTIDEIGSASVTLSKAGQTKTLSMN